MGTGSLGSGLCWLCTSEEDKWLIFWDSVKSNLLTRRGNGGGSSRKMNLLEPTSKSTHMLHGPRKEASRAAVSFLTSVSLRLGLPLRGPPSVAHASRSLVQGPHTWKLTPAFPTHTHLFPSARSVLQSKPNQQLCIFRVGSVQWLSKLILGQVRTVGWGKRVEKIGIGGLWGVGGGDWNLLVVFYKSSLPCG